MKTLEERFEELMDFSEGQYLRFERVENKLSDRPDIHAMILLDKLQPKPGRDMVADADHDIIYLDVDDEKLNEVITDDQILELVRCGVHYNGDGGGLAMFA